MHLKLDFNKLYNNTIIALIMIVLLYSLLNCYIVRHTTKCFDITQGNYLTKSDIKKISIGMTKLEISSTIGTPTLQSLFESNIWHYIFYHCHSNKMIQYQIITLKFDINNILIAINTE